MTIKPATTSWRMSKRHTPAPRSFGWPYRPVKTYTVACPSEIINANTIEQQDHCQLQNFSLYKSASLTLLSSSKQGTIFFETEIDFYQVGTSKQLHNHTRSDNGWDTKLHQCTPIWSQNNSHPVKRITWIWRHDTIQWNLRSDQEDGKDNGSPSNSGLKGNWRQQLFVQQSLFSLLSSNK